MEFIKPVYELSDDIDYMEFAINHIQLFCKKACYPVIEFIYDTFHYDQSIFNELSKHIIYYGLHDLILKYNIGIPPVLQDVHSKTHINYFKKVSNATKLSDHLIVKMTKKKRNDVILLYLDKIDINDSLIDTICVCGNDALLQVLKEKGHVQNLNDRQLYKLLKNGHLDMFSEWYKTGINTLSGKMFKYIAYYKFDDAALHMVSSFPDTCEELVLYIAACGHDRLLEKVLDKFHIDHLKDQDRLIHYACASENSETVDVCLEYLKKNDRHISGVVNTVKYDSNEKPLYIYLINKYGVTTEDKLEFIKGRVSKTLEEIRQIETYLQRSPEWFKAREFAVSSTNTAAMLGHNKYQNYDQFAKDKLWGTFKGNDATMYGNSFEIFAYDRTLVQLCKEYIGRKNAMFVTLRDPGFILSNDHPWLGASSDGIVNVHYANDITETLTIELKAPYHKNEFYPEIPHQYYDQIMTAMKVTLTNECKFVVHLQDQFRYDTYKFCPIYWKTEVMPGLYEKYFDNLLASMILKDKERLYKGTIKPAIVFNYADINLF